jgi:isochorismate synthase
MSQVAPTARAVASPAPHEHVLARGLERAAHAPGLTVIAIPAPHGAVAALVDPIAGVGGAVDAAFAWEVKDSDEAWAGIGVAAEVRATGADRFGAIARAAAATWARVDSEPGAPAPRMFGGFAFAPGTAAGGAWRALGDAWFALPRWTYVRRGGAAWWLIAVDAAGAREPGRWYAELAALEAALAAGPATTASPVLARTDVPRAIWTRQVEDICAAIAAGQLAKVVAARPCAVELGAPASTGAVLARLGAAHAECTRFAIRAGATAFTGATPERLIRRRGRAIDSEALAGSIARSHPDGAAALLASSKDRIEHEVVVSAIAAALAPFCARGADGAIRLTRSDGVPLGHPPAVRALRHILHLHTPIAAELAEPFHVLELARALHPTPAVGGTPTADAVAWISAHEPAPRGWYAAPVGWFDASGDGEFAVALRSGLLAGRTAEIWAGAGIVRDSDEAAEWAEVELKQRALFGALEGP